MKSILFGRLSDGRNVREHTLANANGVVVKVLDYGGIIRALEVPDRHGQPADIVLGFDNIEQYEERHPYFGAIIGRVAGRISCGRMRIGDSEYRLPVNESPNHLHGGHAGFDRVMWDTDQSGQSNKLTMKYVSPDGEEGYPGTLYARVTYRLTDADEFVVTYHATTDASTVVNLTQHSYFNLSGDPQKQVLDHELTVLSDSVLEPGQDACPTGRVLDVSGSRFDLRQPGLVGEFDNYWILPGAVRNGKPKVAAVLRHKQSGRTMEVSTTAPGVQVYSGSELPAGIRGKNGRIYGPSSGICLETQVHPDSPNHAGFPDIVLGPGEEFESTTVFRFSSESE